MLANLRASADIDLDAVAFNTQNIRKLVDENVEIIGVVKADAYGHGAIETAKVLLRNGVTRLAVAMAEEAIQLRKADIKAPILILGYVPCDYYDDIIENDIAVAIFSLENAEILSRRAVELGKKARVHIKIDTGMGRIGFMPEKNDFDAVAKIAALDNLRAEGVFTHFASADESDKTFAYKQLDKFKLALDEMKKRGVSFDVIHCANSAAIMDFGKETCFNAVRAGIILYGLYPSNEVKKQNLPLKPVMSVNSVISHVKRVPSGAPISYGGDFVTRRESVIATVPVGYADGFIRKMSNGGRVLVNGKFAPVVGRVCMDQFMLDVTDIDCKTGDCVTILGKNGNEEITADEIASVLETINYEAVCAVGKRVPRRYISNGEVVKIIKYV